MKFILQQFWSKEYQPLADITYPNKQWYAHKHGYECKYALHSEPYSCWDRPRLWAKCIEHAYEGDYILFTGCDTIILKPEVSFKFWLESANFPDLLITLDNDVCFSDAFIVKACEATLSMFYWIANTGYIAYSNEQEALTSYLAQTPSYSDVRLKLGNVPEKYSFYQHAEHTLNQSKVRVSIQCNDFVADYQKLSAPGVIPDTHSVGSDTFIAHFGGKSLQYRLNVIPRFLPL